LFRVENYKIEYVSAKDVYKSMYCMYTKDVMLKNLDLTAAMRFNYVELLNGYEILVLKYD